jgi:hypothetical protein
VSELLDEGLVPKSGFKFFGGRGKGNEKPAANSNGRKDKAEVKRKEGRKETENTNEGTGKAGVKRKDTKKRAAQFIPTQKDAFEAYNVSQLKAIARASKIIVSSCVERSQIVEKLLSHGVVKPAPYVGYSVWKLKKVAKEKTVYFGMRGKGRLRNPSHYLYILSQTLANFGIVATRNYCSTRVSSDWCYSTLAY